MKAAQVEPFVCPDCLQTMENILVKKEAPFGRILFSLSSKKV